MRRTGSRACEVLFHSRRDSSSRISILTRKGRSPVEFQEWVEQELLKTIVL